MSHPQKQILNDILDKVKNPHQNSQPLAIFDLDGTLIDVQNRMLEIFKDFARLPSVAKQFPQVPSVILNTSVLPSRKYYIEDYFEDLKLGHLDESFHASLLKFWKKCFFSNDYLKYDVPFPGALDFLAKLKSYHVKIVYLTGRDEKRMGEGTRKYLLDKGFMDGKQIQLILKPHKAMDDALFKKNVILNFDKYYHPIWFFDNEPFIINPVIKETPHINVIFFESSHSRRDAPPGQKVHRIQSFEH